VCETRHDGALKADIMTSNASFKKRIRERMARTGERYGAARRVLIDQSTNRPTGSRVWVSQPEQPDESVIAHTGRSWDDWCDLIDTWPEAEQGHAAVAARVLDEFDVTGWWGQGITVGWERITGRRLVNQMSDGTFTASIGRTRPVVAPARAHGRREEFATRVRCARQGSYSAASEPRMRDRVRSSVERSPCDVCAAQWKERPGAALHRPR
jgi:hypothetical protein